MENTNSLKCPLISIVIPAYNQTRYLALAIESAIKQTYKNTEILICDDSNTYAVKNLVSYYMRSNNNIIYYNNGGPLGELGILNCEKCFEKANGEYISYLFHDDYYYPTKIEKMVDKFLKDDSITLVTSSRLVINEKNEVINKLELPYNKDVRLSGNEVARKLIFSMHNFVGELTTVMFRKKDMVSSEVRLLDYYNSNIKCLGDIALFLKLCARGNVYFINEFLSAFRVHSQQNTKNLNIVDWSPIDFLNIIIDSYEKKLFIYTEEELDLILVSWEKIYSFMMSRAINTCKNSVENKDLYYKFKDRLKRYNIRLDGIEV